MVIRISCGRFDPARADEVERALHAQETTLGPAIKRMAGLQSYQTGFDRAGGVMLAVSVWATHEDAGAMGRLAEMQAARVAFEQSGIVFDPIAAYEVLWQV